jgi:hypothetical protein
MVVPVVRRTLTEVSLSVGQAAGLDGKLAPYRSRMDRHR